MKPIKYFELGPNIACIAFCLHIKQVMSPERQLAQVTVLLAVYFKTDMQANSRTGEEEIIIIIKICPLLKMNIGSFFRPMKKPLTH